MSDPRQRPVVDIATMRRFAGVVTTLSGAFMIIFSYVPWLRYSPAGPAEANRDPIALSGFGGTLPDGTGYGGMDPATWTVIIGAVLLVCGLGIVADFGGAVTATLAVGASSVGLVLVGFFLSNPQAAFDLSADRLAPGAFLSAEWGLWLTFVSVVFATTGALSALSCVVQAARAAGDGTAAHGDGATSA